MEAGGCEHVLLQVHGNESQRVAVARGGTHRVLRGLAVAPAGAEDGGVAVKVWRWLAVLRVLAKLPHQRGAAARRRRRLVLARWHHCDVAVAAPQRPLNSAVGGKGLVVVQQEATGAAGLQLKGVLVSVRKARRWMHGSWRTEAALSANSSAGIPKQRQQCAHLRLDLPLGLGLLVAAAGHQLLKSQVAPLLVLTVLLHRRAWRRTSAGGLQGQGRGRGVGGQIVRLQQRPQLAPAAHADSLPYS